MPQTTFSNPRTYKGHTFVTRAPGNPTAAFHRDASSVDLQILLWPFSDYYSFAKDALGYGKLVNDNNHWYLSRVTPMPLASMFDSTQQDAQLQDTSGNPFLFCTQISRIVPVHFNRNLFTGYYDLALMDLKFETLPYEIVPDSVLPFDATYSLPNEGIQWSRYLTIKGKPEVQVLQLPRGAFRYAGTTTRHPYPGGFVVGKVGFEVVWHDVPTNAIASKQLPGWNSFSGTPFIDNALGCVNADSYNGKPAGTLLFESWDFEPHRSPFGDRTYDVTFHFSYNPQKWNYVPRVTSGTSRTWSLITADGSSPSDSDNAAGGTSNDGLRMYNTRAFFQLHLAPDP